MSEPTYRYVYLGHSGTAPWLRGQRCDPIVDPTTGKYVLGRANQLVKFEDGSVRIVILRRLRVRGEEGTPATWRNATTTFHRPVTTQANLLFGHRNDWSQYCSFCPEFVEVGA